MNRKQKLNLIRFECDKSFGKICILRNKIDIECAKIREQIQEYIDLHNDGDVICGLYIKNGHLYEGHSVINLDECDDYVLQEIFDEIF